MIDIHSHILPGLDDGARDMAVSLDMARMAVADGIVAMVCSPHILPTVYDNVGERIEAAVTDLRAALADAGIGLALYSGADVHVSPDVLSGLKTGRVLAINRSRYLLLEPPHHIMPPRFESFIFDLMTSGYTPILTHPERLTWIEQRYDVIQKLAFSGMPMQITAGSLTGRFGRRPKFWAEKMLGEGLLDILATDAHDTAARAPRLREARDIVATALGEDEAFNVTYHRPHVVLSGKERGELRLRRTPNVGASNANIWKSALGALKRR